jgi:hypothetical protein
MIETEQIPRSYREAVNALVRWQGEGGPSDLTILRRIERPWPSLLLTFATEVEP